MSVILSSNWLEIIVIKWCFDNANYQMYFSSYAKMRIVPQMVKNMRELELVFQCSWAVACIVAFHKLVIRGESYSVSDSGRRKYFRMRKVRLQLWLPYYLLS